MNHKIALRIERDVDGIVTVSLDVNPDKPRGADFYPSPDGELLHLTNWVEAVRARKPAIAPAESGVLAAASAQLANQALRTGQVAHWGK